MGSCPDTDIDNSLLHLTTSEISLRQCLYVRIAPPPPPLHPTHHSQGFFVLSLNPIVTFTVLIEAKNTTVILAM